MGAQAVPFRFGVVGSGWRAEFFARVARQVPERFAVAGVVTRTAGRGAEVERDWGVPTVRTVAELVRGDAGSRPDLVVVSTPWDVTPGVIRELVAAGVPVLTETPPAPDADALDALWRDVGASGLVQVAEHSPFLPMHVARATLARRGLLGEVTSVQVSSTHRHHAAGLVRHLLGTGLADVTVRAQAFTAPLLDPMNRAGWTGATEPRGARTVLATLDLGAGRSALYDFTDNQWHNPLRANRIVLRGSAGELVDDRLVRWTDPRTVVESRLVRRQYGIEQDMDGFDLDHVSLDGEVLYRNPFVGARLADDDLAVAGLLAGSADWVRGDGPAPYPLAEGSHDHRIGLAIEESVRTGEPVGVVAPVWAR